MNNWKTLSCGFLIAASLASCATTSGVDFDTNQVDQMRIGQTTTRQTMTALGEPFRRNIRADGTEEWLYDYTETSSSVSPAAFIPYIGPFIPNTATNKLTNRELRLVFEDDVLASCRMQFYETEGSGNALNNGGVNEALSGGTVQEIDCGQAP